MASAASRASAAPERRAASRAARERELACTTLGRRRRRLPRQRQMQRAVQVQVRGPAVRLQRGLARRLPRPTPSLRCSALQAQVSRLASSPTLARRWRSCSICSSCSAWAAPALVREVRLVRRSRAPKSATRCVLLLLVCFRYPLIVQNIALTSELLRRTERARAAAQHGLYECDEERQGAPCLGCVFLPTASFCHIEADGPCRALPQADSSRAPLPGCSRTPSDPVRSPSHPLPAAVLVVLAISSR